MHRIKFDLQGLGVPVKYHLFALQLQPFPLAALSWGVSVPWWLLDSRQFPPQPEVPLGSLLYRFLLIIGLIVSSL